MITDDDIRVFRDESRATGDQQRVRAANAALGLPTGDGALGLLDAAVCRSRVAEIIAREHTPGTSAAHVTADTVTDEEIRQLYTFGHISHATWINGIVHPATRLGRLARAQCAEIVTALATAAGKRCTRCGIPVHRSWDHLDVGEHGERWTCLGSQSGSVPA